MHEAGKGREQRSRTDTTLERLYTSTLDIRIFSMEAELGLT